MRANSSRIDASDRKNMRLFGIAILVALTIFVCLEYKQLHDAAHEAKHAATGFFIAK